MPSRRAPQWAGLEHHGVSDGRATCLGRDSRGTVFATPASGVCEPGLAARRLDDACQERPKATLGSRRAPPKSSRFAALSERLLSSFRCGIYFITVSERLDRV